MADIEIKPYAHDTTSKHKQVEAMFNDIAPTYDCLNHTLSLGIDRLWRRSLIRHIARYKPHTDHVLDVATGTGDLAIEACKRLHTPMITACDIADSMMRIAIEKAERQRLTHRMQFMHEDCEHLTFDDDTFDVVMSAFALRNFENLDACLAEIYRVTTPGGMVAIIDLCAPQRWPMTSIFRIYRHWLMPAAGKLLAHNTQAYSYLPHTMSATEQGADMAVHFALANFQNVKFRYLAFDMCCLYTGIKS